MTPLEIIVKGDSSQATTALQKTQAELVKTSVAAQKTDSSLQTFSKSSGQSMFNLTEKIRSLQSSVFTEKDRNKIALYNAEIKTTEIELAKLNSIGISSGNGMAAGATKAYSAIRTIANILPAVGIGTVVGFIATPIVEYVKHLLEATEAEKQLAIQAKLIADLNSETAKNYGKEASSLTILRAEIESSLVPMNKRLQAIKDLKSQYPEYFNNLTTDQLLNGKVANAYDLAAAAILRKARATAAASAIEEIASKKLEIQLKNQQDVEKTNAELAAARDKVITQKGTGDAAGTQRTNTAASQREGIRIAYEIRRKANQEEIDQLNKQQAFLLKIAVDGANETIKIEKEKVEKLKNIREGKSEKPLKLFTYIFEAPKPTGPPPVIKPEILVKPTFVVSPKSEKEVLAAFEKFLLNEKLKDAINASITTLISDTISATADAVADALSGGKDVVPRLFDNIIKGVGQQIKELGKFMVEAGIKKLALDKAIKALGLNPALTIVAGFALQVLGGVLIAAAQKKSSTVGFATGTRNVRESGFYNVGERGQERIFLPAGSSVQPNNEVTAYGGGGITLMPSIEYSGAGFRIMLDRVDKQFGRNN